MTCTQSQRPSRRRW